MLRRKSDPRITRNTRNQNNAGAGAVVASCTRAYAFLDRYCGDVAAAGLLAAAGEAVVAGDVVAAGVVAAGVVAAGLAPGTAPGDAGLKPRLAGLLTIKLARLLTTLASFMAVSSSAAFRISLRWFMRA